MPPVIKGVLVLIACFLVLCFLWGASVALADLIVNGGL